VNGDAQGSNNGRVRFEDKVNHDPCTQPRPIRFDNYDAGTDNAHITLDNFTYYLNRFDIVLNANLQFGGVLSVIPTLASVPIFRMTIDLDDSGIPIGQHAGMEPIDIPVFVENHALAVTASPKNNDANKIDEHTMMIKPGEFGDFKCRSIIAAAFLRTWTTSRARFRIVLIRVRRSPSSSIATLISIAPVWRELPRYPYDGIADDCFAADGTLLAVALRRSMKTRQPRDRPGSFARYGWRRLGG